MVEEGMARVLGRPAFHDTSLATELALLTGNWTHTVAFVGHNVPYQAMEVSRLIESHSVGVDATRVSFVISSAFGRDSGSERPQTRKRNHPRPPLLQTTRVDGVKVPQHCGTLSHGP